MNSPAEAINRPPDFDPWTAAMQRGDFAAAWAISDAVMQARRRSGDTCWHWPRHLQYVWTGAPLAGRRVLVRCYHGLGDTIQFARFAAPLRRIAREVVFWTQPALIDLLATVEGIDEVLPLHDGVPQTHYDVDIESMEVAHALRVDAGSMPAVPYLQAPRAAIDADGELAVGLVWQAGGWDTRRSVPATLLRRLADVPGVQLYSLQRGDAAREAATIGARDIGCDDSVETAARMCGLDRIICVDTMAAHLAGALGCPTWTLLHAQCDWRWPENGARTVWYPTMRLFRQPRAGDWHPVINDVCAALMEASRRKLRV